MKELRLSIAIAFGVFGGLSAWSWVHPWPVQTVAQHANFQTAGYANAPVEVRIVDVTPDIILDVNIKQNSVSAECGSYRAQPCYVRVAN